MNDFGHGTFISVAAGATLTAHDNVFAGTGTPASTGALSSDNLSGQNPMFIDPSMYDYHLMGGSPAIGKGNTSFSIAKTNIPIDPNFGATAINPPGADIGCYQSNGTGLGN